MGLSVVVGLGPGTAGRAGLYESYSIAVDVSFWIVPQSLE